MRRSEETMMRMGGMMIEKEVTGIRIDVMDKRMDKLEDDMRKRRAQREKRNEIGRVQDIKQK